MNGTLLEYAKAILDTSIPEIYMAGRNHQMVEENLKTHKKVMFTGPKGVGKTACLLAYWQKFVSLKKKVILLCPSTIKMFFENHAIQCYLKSLHKGFEHTKTETSLRLTISKYIIQENPIVLLVSMSSGCGSNFSLTRNSTRNKEKLDSALLCFKSVEFLPLNKTEVILFIQFNEEQEESDTLITSMLSEEKASIIARKLKPYAGYNPYLICHSLQVAEEQHIIGNESLAVCIQKIEQYIQHGPLFCSQIEKIAECFHFAKQNRWMDAVFYIASFVYTHRLAYIVDHNQDSVIIGMNFPLLPKLIKGYPQGKMVCYF